MSTGELIEFMQSNGYRINLDNTIPSSVTVPKLEREFANGF